MKRLARAAAPAFLALAALLPLAGCTASPTRPPTPSPHPRTQSQLREEAESKLTHSPTRALHWTGPVQGPSMLPTTKLAVQKGKPYVIEAACAGSGTFEFSWKSRSTHSGTPHVTCGGTALRYPFVGGDLLSFTFETWKPAAGVLTWQVVPGDA
ncbi:hypothetical protein [Actinacidiphila guanduensis]|uniref:Lipoprotein n=1 Tax=Actinacidiphila guanduensis TaxID=310781 RepID=A0A1H0P3G6_9ACTN|nr:hypothetical protein [Actinacidiphila guanduensis]SDO99562.1 hypothetical protein SAMN05216259_11545 [Actinacidiphila guanduensis]